MPVNQVNMNGEELINLTNDTVSEDTLLEGETAHDASGKQITGKVVVTPVDSELNAESANAIQNKAVAEALTNVEARRLKNYYDKRPSSANLESDGTGGLRKFLCTTSMTEGAAPVESHIIHMAWDTTSGWDAQLAVGCGQNKVFARNKKAGIWQEWFNVADGGNADTVDGKHANDFALANSSATVICGSYAGTGSIQTINVGATPKAVLVSARPACSDLTMATDKLAATQNDGTVRVAVVTNGFQVHYAHSTPDTVYSYIALV